MSRCISLLAIVLTYSHATGQELAFDHGKVEFHTASIMSDIEAETSDIDATLDLATGEVYIRIPIASFEFEYEMMRDHFNEEYMESDTYPEAIFKGKVGNISVPIATQDVHVRGSLTIHGITQNTSMKVALSQSNGMTKVKSSFQVVFKEFGIDEPSILTRSVAKDVEVKVLLYMQ